MTHIPICRFGRRFQCSLMKQYVPMVAKLCWKYWACLPASIRVWIDVEDLVYECIAYIQFDSSRVYDGRTKISTFVYMSTERYLINVVKKYSCRKRNTQIVKVEDLNSLFVVDQMPLSKLYEARLALQQVYKQASPRLRCQMKMWFGTPPRIKKSSDFDMAKKEFLSLSTRCKVTRQDYHLLLETNFPVL